jgi:hypothetical protein
MLNVEKLKLNLRKLSKIEKRIKIIFNIKSLELEYPFIIKDDDGNRN